MDETTTDPPGAGATPTLLEAARAVADHFTMMNSWGPGFVLSPAAYPEKLAATSAAIETLIAVIARLDAQDAQEETR